MTFAEIVSYWVLLYNGWWFKTTLKWNKTLIWLHVSNFELFSNGTKLCTKISIAVNCNYGIKHSYSSYEDVIKSNNRCLCLQNVLISRQNRLNWCGYSKYISKYPHTYTRNVKCAKRKTTPALFHVINEYAQTKLMLHIWLMIVHASIIS